MDHSRYIEYLLNKRTRRRSRDFDSIHKVYASKYKDWISEYLKQNQIDEVPLFIVCNTLYKLPDTFKIGNNSFFIGDFYLFIYFYDWNYILSNENFREHMVNLCVKQYIESCYLNDEINEAYWLCNSSDGLEDYKIAGTYSNEEVKSYLADRTDIQEEFAMIHEAGHYLCRFIDKEIAFRWIKELYEELHNKTAFAEYFEYIKDTDEDLMGLFEECYCDSQAALYVIGHLNQKGNIEKGECYMLIFKTLFYIYSLQYISIVSQKEIEVTGGYFDRQLWVLVYRMANIYNTLYAQVIDEGTLYEIEILSNTYEKFNDLLQVTMEEIRQIMLYIKKTMIDNKDSLDEANKISNAEKIKFIKEYLKLL